MIDKAVTQEIKIETTDIGPVAVSAEVYGELAVHSSHIGGGQFAWDHFTVTHIATGCFLGYGNSLMLAVAFARAVNAAKLPLMELHLQYLHGEAVDPNAKEVIRKLAIQYRMQLIQGDSQ